MIQYIIIAVSMEEQMFKFVWHHFDKLFSANTGGFIGTSTCFFSEITSHLDALASSHGQALGAVRTEMPVLETLTIMKHTFQYKDAIQTMSQHI